MPGVKLTNTQHSKKERARERWGGERQTDRDTDRKNDRDRETDSDRDRYVAEK